MSTILGSQVAPLSARRKWCWASAGIRWQQAGEAFIHCLNDQWAWFSIPWISSKMLHAVLCLKSKTKWFEKRPLSVLLLQYQRRLLRKRRGKGKTQHLWIPRRALVFNCSHTWLSLSPAEGSTGASTNAPQPLQCFWAAISLCAACTSACTSACFEGFAEEALSGRVLKSFLLSNVGLG